MRIIAGRHGCDCHQLTETSARIGQCRARCCSRTACRAPRAVTCFATRHRGSPARARPVNFSSELPPASGPQASRIRDATRRTVMPVPVPTFTAGALAFAWVANDANTAPASSTSTPVTQLSAVACKLDEWHGLRKLAAQIPKQLLAQARSVNREQPRDDAADTVICTIRMAQRRVHQLMVAVRRDRILLCFLVDRAIVAGTIHSGARRHDQARCRTLLPYPFEHCSRGADCAKKVLMRVCYGSPDG